MVSVHHVIRRQFGCLKTVLPKRMQKLVYNVEGQLGGYLCSTKADMSEILSERLVKRRERKLVKWENSAMDVSVSVSVKTGRIRNHQRRLCIRTHIGRSVYTFYGSRTELRIMERIRELEFKRRG